MSDYNMTSFDEDERTFSSRRRLKNYLRLTMGQEQLNNLLLHIHKDMTDKIDILDIAREFVQTNERRLLCSFLLSPYK